MKRFTITLLALFCALCVGIWVGARPDTPVLGGLKDLIAPSPVEISIDEVEELIRYEFYRDVPDAKLTDGSIRGMVEALDDKFSHYFDSRQNKAFEQAISGRYSGVGMAVNQHPRGLLVTTVYPGSPAQGAGIKRGDVITEVNGKSIAGEPADAAVAKVKGKEGTRVSLTFARPVPAAGEKGGKSEKLGEEKTIELTRKAIDIPVASGKLYRRDGRKVGYVQLLSYTANSGRLVGEQIKRLKRRGAKAWVLDLRGNGGGRLDQAVEVTSAFIPDGMIVATDGRSVRREVHDADKDSFQTADDLVVLVDKGSASASEISAGAIKFRDRGLIVGTRTYGKGTFQEVTELSNGGALSLTIGRYELPGRHFITKSGLKPDLTVKDSHKRPGDEQLKAAFSALAAMDKAQ